MLGVETRRDPIRGEFARRIREQLRRAHSQKADKANNLDSIPSSTTGNQYHAVWK